MPNNNLSALASERLLSVLDDDASCFTRGGKAGDGVSLRGADRSDDFFHLACALGLSLNSC